MPRQLAFAAAGQGRWRRRHAMTLVLYSRTYSLYEIP